MLESTKRFFGARNGGDGALSAGQLLVAGSLAGLANSVVSGPVEHIRIRLQTQSDKNRLYAGPGDALKKIVASHGVAGLYKVRGCARHVLADARAQGQVATLWREGIGYAAYFLTYEKLMEREMRVHNVKREDVSGAKAVLFGATAGYAVRPSLPRLSPLSSSRSCGRAYTPST